MSRMLDRRNALKMGVLTVIGLGALSGHLEASAGLQSQNKIARTTVTGTGRTTPQAGKTTSNELHQAVAYMLDPDAMSRSMVSFVEEKRQEVFATSQDAAEDMKMYPGFEDRVRRRVAQEVRNTVLQRIPDLQRQYDGLLRPRLTPDDIKRLLAFESDPISAQLRGPAYVQALEADDPSGADISERIVAKMTPQQRAFSARFLRSPAGRKVVALGPQLEALRNDWIRRAVDEVARRMPAIADSIIQQYQR
ncbi:hypothetical protein [Edaphobacter modestus]|uniref:DUF2059 domain-containing protein n=1 Tax=Edaphobacter modestus TaxID=388466 RepID=A0A4Q7YGY6_9BACT|nr:hypothetical protein [Edaphobacter modestus]RZU35655.1 hypothetical protein BDD14_5743 [Edaphobacter modestus]